jgi:hypothetical protein
MRKLAVGTALALMSAVICCGAARTGEAASLPELSLNESAIASLPEGAGEIAVSANLQRIAYVAPREGGQCVVVDGKAGTTYQQVYGVAVSPTGKHFAYAAVQDGGTLLVYDGVEKREADGRIAITFGPDDQRMAYTVFRPGAGEPSTYTGPRGTARVVIDGTEGREYDWVGHVTFSPDGKRVAYTAILGQRGVVVVDGVEGQPFDSSFERPGGCPAFRPNGKVAYAQQRRKRTIGGALFKRAGLADDYAARAVIGSGEGKEYSEVHDIAFSPDGGRFGYAAARISGKERHERAVVDGLENREYAEVRSLVFSPNGRHVAYVGRRGEESVVVVGGAERYTFQTIGDLFFTPDSEHLAFWAGRGPDWFLVVDGVAAGRWDSPATKALAFPQAGTMRALARRGDTLVDVRLTVQGSSGR